MKVVGYVVKGDSVLFGTTWMELEVTTLSNIRDERQLLFGFWRTHTQNLESRKIKKQTRVFNS